MTRTLSPAAALRILADADRTADAIFASGQDMADYCTALAAQIKRQTEAIRQMIEEEQELERAREFTGPTLTPRRGAA